jgi:hypothetical protein
MHDKPLRNRKLILLELNEINFDVVNQYLESQASRFPALGKLVLGQKIITSSEEKYDEIEPWIQWPSVHSGLSYSEHRIFRLGDIVGSKVPQFFEQLEQIGISVGCISAMNAENRLESPAYFVPDPWTETASDKSWWSRMLTSAISQSVNDNAQSRISIKSILILLFGLIRFAQPKHYYLYFRLAIQSCIAPWRKALFLDLFLHDLHKRLFGARKPNFSTLFLNAGAHIQHHYFFNSGPVKKKIKLRNPSGYVSPLIDPVAEMLEIYDRILEDYTKIPNVDLIIATGLSQCPYDTLKFYYRLRDHSSFLRLLDIEFKVVLPRMTRDFLIEFDSHYQAIIAQERLGNIEISGSNEPMFGEIDNRGKSLFVTLTFPYEINSFTIFELDSIQYLLEPHVAFVAIKNGMHQNKGFAFFSEGVAPHAPENYAHVKELYSTVTKYFGASD